MTEYQEVKTPKCPVCKSKKWVQVEEIPVTLKSGRASKTKMAFKVFQCEKCGQRRLDQWL